MPPVSNPGTGLGRTKSQARRPSALNLPPHPHKPDSSALLSPTSACVSPTFANSVSRLSRRALQKVSIIDQSRTVMIEIDESTTVTDLLKEAEQLGELQRQSQGFGEWGVFEVWKDLGIGKW